jgi:hypothetical protein
MNQADTAATWRAFLLILGMATTAAGLYWLVWGVSGGPGAAVLSAGALSGYLGGTYYVIRRGGFRRGLVAQFVFLAAAALLGTWLLGAMIALMVWGDPIGPPN